MPPGGEIAAKPKPKRREPTAEQLAAGRGDGDPPHRRRAGAQQAAGPRHAGRHRHHLHVDGLLDAFAGEDEPRPRLVHRLDKDTSGVLLIARTPGSAAFFSKRFSGRSAKKIYWALVVGVPDVGDGMIDAPLAKQPGTGGEKMHVDEENGQPARTRYRVVDRAGNRAAWVELQPLTGRTHQLRVHMAAIGHPIVGDGKYGGQEAFLTGSISRKMHLHARRLIIDAPRTDGSGDDRRHRRAARAFRREHGAARLRSRRQRRRARRRARRRPRARRRSRPRKAHAKKYRKARRGERRTRTAGRAEAASRTGGASADASQPAVPHRGPRAARSLIDEIGFGMVFAQTPDGPRVAHMPLVSTGDGAVHFHLARGNALTRHSPAATALAVINGPDAYVSPRWYADRGTGADLELRRARARRAGAADGRRRACTRLLEAIGKREEARIAAGEPWRPEEVPQDLWNKLLNGIVGFELEVRAWRPTFKLSQNKPPEERARIADALEAHGSPALAALMRTLRRMTVRLAVFDCDGTLVDGQAAICAAMAEGFAEAGLAAARSAPGAPHRRAEPAAARSPGSRPTRRPKRTARAVDAYKQAFFRARERGRAAASRCSRASPRCSGGCTPPAGRSASPPASPTAACAGCLAMHGIFDLFVTLQTADRHPSKPHPAMLEAAMAEAGARPADTVMIGDTVYDIEMARAAGMPCNRRRLGLS